MRLFGTSQQASFQKKAEKPAALQSSLAELSENNNNYDKELDSALKLVLDNHEIDSGSQLPVYPAKESAAPVVTYRHQKMQSNENTASEDDDSEEINSSMPGWLKGTLLLLSSAVLFVLVLFGVYMNLV